MFTIKLTSLCDVIIYHVVDESDRFPVDDLDVFWLFPGPGIDLTKSSLRIEWITACLLQSYILTTVTVVLLKES